MLNLILAIMSSSLISVIMRVSEGKVKENSVGMLMVNYVMCSIVGGMYMGFENAFPHTEGIALTLGMGVFNGFLYLAGFMLMQINVRKNGIVLSSVFSKLGLLVPMVVSVIIFRERPEIIQIIGFLIAVGAIILINSDPDAPKGKFGGTLILGLLVGGISDTMSKIFEQVGNDALSDQFLFYTFLFALVFCIGIMLYKKERPGKNEILFGLMIGVPNYFSSRFLLASLRSIPAVIVYPTYSVATLIVITLPVLLFSENLWEKGSGARLYLL